MFAGPYEVEGPALQRFEYAVGDATMAMKTSEITTLFQRVVA
jgi:hypothetical protein